jgi:alpha-tubulin suppressor-like RCC1 family protein
VSKPVDVVGLATGVRAISAGEVHTCAVMTNGGAKCWGWNYYGQVGNGTKTGISGGELISVNVSGLTAGVSGIGLGSAHTCAQLTNGGVNCWGFNVKGQLGDDTIVERLSPVCVVGFVCGVFVYLPSAIR